MQRAPLGLKSYWDERIAKFEGTLASDLSSLNAAPVNIFYEPQFWFEHSRYIFRLMLLRYSRGDPIAELKQYFPILLDGWERSNTWMEELSRTQAEEPRRSWTFELTSLNHYNWCFWLIGLALILEIPNNDWQRLLRLVDSAGNDALLDRVIKSRHGARVSTNTILHPKPYARLMKAIDAPKIVQAELLRDFVVHWYPELARERNEELWWYIYGHPEMHPLSMGSYFGRWCIEAAVVSKVFDISDSLCLGLEHYPGDLLRPEEPSTHTGVLNAIQTQEGARSHASGILDGLLMRTRRSIRKLLGKKGRGW